MALEIERKFLVANEAWREDADQGRQLSQAYLAGTDKAVVRVRIENDSRAAVTIKSTATELTRQEYEYEIPVKDARELLRLRSGAILSKRRFHVPAAGRTWEVDVYAGDNAGLVLAEAELRSENEHLERPAWLGREVTGDKRYYASQLAETPFSSWAGSRSSQ